MTTENVCCYSNSFAPDDSLVAMGMHTKEEEI